MLPILNDTQIRELITESAGRAVSFQDSPEWFCGVRKSTHMARDDYQTSEYQGPGTCHALAYSMRDHCAEYQRTLGDIAYNTERAKSLEAELIAEEKRKTPRKRKMAELGRELWIAHQDIRNAHARIETLVAKYFRGYEGRLLVEVSGQDRR